MPIIEEAIYNNAMPRTNVRDRGIASPVKDDVKFTVTLQIQHGDCSPCPRQTGYR